jgi:hypothetical protein
MDWKKIWEGIKNFFIIFGIICAIAACYLFFNNKKAEEYIKILEGRIRSRDQELEAARNIETQRQAQQQQREADLNRIIDDLRKQNADLIKEINADTQDAINAAYDQYKDDPEKQAAEIRRILGVPDS